MVKNIKSILTKGERVLYDARVHWIVFASPVFYAFIGVLAGVFFHPLIGFLILFMDFYPIYSATVMYITTHLVLTNQKVVGRIGFLSRDWTQLTLDRVETAFLEEPIIGRIIGYSTVVVRGIGSGSIAFPYIIDGDVFVKELEKILSERRAKLEAG